MILTEKAKAAARKKDARIKLAEIFGLTEISIYRIIKDNKSNGPLTTVGALKVIKETTGLTEEEILQPVSIGQN